MDATQKTRRAEQLAWKRSFPFWSILESYIYSHRKLFKSIKGFATTDTVNIEHKNDSSLWLWP